MARMLLALIFTFGFLTALDPSAARAERDIGKVSKKVFLGAYGVRTGGDKETLYYRTKVFENEIVSTVKGAETTLRFVDRTKLQLGPKSTLTLDTFIYDPDKATGDMSLEFTKGLFRFITGKMSKNEGCKLSTPTAFVGIRGTDFIIQVDAAGTTQLAVLSGQVEVTPRDGGAAAMAVVGQTVTVTAANAAATATQGVGAFANHQSMQDNAY